MSRKRAEQEEEHQEDVVRPAAGEHQGVAPEAVAVSLVALQAEVVAHHVAEEHREVAALVHVEVSVEGAIESLCITAPQALQALWADTHRGRIFSRRGTET